MDEQSANPQSQNPSPVMSTDTVKEPKKIKKSILIVLVIVVLLAAVGVLGFLYYKEKTKTADPEALASEEAQKTLEKLGALILLPADDTSRTDDDPAVATIIDIDKLKADNPEFYKDAKNGDKLIVYTNRAILYDPERDLIINVAPVIKSPEGEDTSVDDQSGSTEPAENN